MSFYYISFTFLNECVIQDWASNALPTLMVFPQKLPWSCVQLTAGYLLLSALLSSCRPTEVNQSQTGYVFWILQSVKLVGHTWVQYLLSWSGQCHHLNTGAKKIVKVCKHGYTEIYVWMKFIYTEMFSSVCLALHKHSFKHLHMEQQRLYNLHTHKDHSLFNWMF